MYSLGRTDHHFPTGRYSYEISADIRSAQVAEEIAAERAPVQQFILGKDEQALPLRPELVHVAIERALATSRRIKRVQRDAGPGPNAFSAVVELMGTGVGIPADHLEKRSLAIEKRTGADQQVRQSMRDRQIYYLSLSKISALFGLACFLRTEDWLPRHRCRGSRFSTCDKCLPALDIRLGHHPSRCADQGWRPDCRV